MELSSVSREVKQIVMDRLGFDEEEITNDSKLIDDLGFDDLDMIEIVMDIEMKYDISILDEDFESITTFKELVDYTYNRLT